MPLAGEDRGHRWPAATHQAGDGLGAAGGGEDGPGLGLGDAAIAEPLPLRQPTLMPWRLPLVEGPAFAALATLQASPAGAIAAGAGVNGAAGAAAGGADVGAEGEGCGGHGDHLSNGTPQIEQLKQRPQVVLGPALAGHLLRDQAHTGLQRLTSG